MAKDYKKVLEDLKKQSSKGGGSDRQYMDLEEGSNTLRILPGHPNMDGFFTEAFYHRKNVGKTGYSVICLNHGDDRASDCPICEELESLRKSKDKKDKKLYGAMRAKPRYFINVIDRSDNQLKILGCGVTILKGILTYVTDEDYGDITDPKEGTDIIIERTGEGLDTEYTVKAKRKSSPALDDPKALKKLIGKSADDTGLYDLTELRAQFEGEPDKVSTVWEGGWEALEEEDDDKPKKKGKKSKQVEEDDEDEEEVKPKKKSKKPVEDDEDEDEEEEAPKSKKKSKPVVEDDEEDEEEEEPKPKAKGKKKPEPEPEEDEEEEDEEEEEAPKPKSKKKSKPVEDEDEEEEEQPKKKSKKKVEDDEDEDDDLGDLDAILKSHTKKGKK